MRNLLPVLFLLFSLVVYGQAFDTTKYVVQITALEGTDSSFRKNPYWQGADGAVSIDLGKGKVLWLFSDTFISDDSAGNRRQSSLVRNSIAIQNGYDLKNSTIAFYWKQLKASGKPDAFFSIKGTDWLWTGHGMMVRDQLIIFLLKERKVDSGLGFEAVGWEAVLVSNPQDHPLHWKKTYLEVPETFGTIVGSAAVLKDDQFIYAFGSVEPATHDVYLIRWKITDVYKGHLKNPQWWFGNEWKARKKKIDIPETLFTGATEYSVHYDSSLRKFIQVQAFGFGKADIGIRMADKIEGKWSTPYMIYTPDYSGIKNPLMYSARAHPEVKGDGLIVTYNINSLDLSELLDNKSIYFPRIVRVRILPR